MIDIVLLIVLIVTVVGMLVVNVKIMMNYLDKDDNSGWIGKIFVVFLYIITNLIGIMFNNC